MKILAVSHEYPPIGGGGANACYYLSKEIGGSGNEVTVVTASYGDLPAEESHGNVRVIRVKALRSNEDKSSFVEMLSFLKGAFFYCDRLAGKERFDACIVFFGIPSGPIGLHLKRKYNIPYVVRFGGGDIPGAQKRFGLIYKLLTPVIHSIWRNASALVANSEVLRERAMAFDQRYPIDIIPNGVDSDRFKKDEAGQIPHKDLNILFVSRLIEGKGLQYIIPDMRDIYDRTGAKLTIVGDGPYRDELERLTDSYKVRDCVSFEGKKGKEDLYRYYNNADIFILPSESEGMPNVVLEAMSMGLPIVMTPCGGAKELIDGNGIISDIDSFCENIKTLCSNDDLRTSYGRQSSVRAREVFGWETTAKAYIRLLDKNKKA